MILYLQKSKNKIKKLILLISIIDLLMSNCLTDIKNAEKITEQKINTEKNIEILKYVCSSRHGIDMVSYDYSYYFNLKIYVLII